MRSRSTTEIFTIVHGNVGVNELLTNLIHAVDIFQVSQFAIIVFVNKAKKIKFFNLNLGAKTCRCGGRKRKAS